MPAVRRPRLLLVIAAVVWVATLFNVVLLLVVDDPPKVQVVLVVSLCLASGVLIGSLPAVERRFGSGPR